MDTSDFIVVCVDDDLEILDVIKNNIISYGHTPMGFSKVDEAIEYLKENHKKVILVLSDLRMDDVNGFQFKKKLKEINLSLPFIILTGYWTKEMSAEAMSLGVDAFIEKPINVEILKENLEKFSFERVQMLSDEQEMIEGFLDETSPMLDEIESLILELEEDPESEQTLSIYFRLLHTIKGTASCVGLTRLGEYTHKYEDFVNGLRSKEYSLNTHNANVLLKGLDGLRNFFQLTYQNGHDEFIDIEQEVKLFTPGESDEKQEIKSDDVSKGIPKTVGGAKERVAEDEKMTVSMSILNQFMEESGELTVIRNSIMKTVKNIEAKYRGDREIELLNDLLDGMHNVTGNIQQKITTMRQVQLNGVFRPFKRLVRDLSKQLSKEVDLIIEGEELYVDNVIAKLFSNTLIHIFRNSLDHGIEQSSERVAKGKSKTGTLKISVKEVGEDILLSVQDDGKGIDPAIIRKKIVEKGLVTEIEARQMADIQVINYIFESGFSTAEQVSDLSGRGVGMDMVRGSFHTMGGDVYVTSKVGEGSCFNLSVPIPKSVLIINTLLICCDGNSFMFPMDQVAEVVNYEKDARNTKMFFVDNSPVIEHNGEMIQLIYLNEVLGLGDRKQYDSYNVVILRFNGNKYGVIVDNIFDFEEVVSKKLNDRVEIDNLYMGASILGSGEVAMIISAEGLASYAKLQHVLGTKTKKYIDSNEELKHDQQVQDFMIFQSSEFDYLAVPLELVVRLENLDAKNLEYTGNNALVHYRGKTLPLVDPSFKLGLSDSNALDSRNEYIQVIVVRGENRDIGFVTYGLDEIQQCFEPMETNYSNYDGLLGSVYIQGKTINVVDVKAISNLISKKKSINQYHAAEIQSLNNLKDAA